MTEFSHIEEAMRQEARAALHKLTEAATYDDGDARGDRAMAEAIDHLVRAAGPDPDEVKAQVRLGSESAREGAPGERTLLERITHSGAEDYVFRMREAGENPRAVADLLADVGIDDDYLKD